MITIMKSYRHWLMMVLGMLFLSGCGAIKNATNYEDPTVKLVSVKALPADGAQQRFAIGLSVTNPNRVPLDIAGMSYTLKLSGYDLASGVAKDVPTIEAFSETPVEIEASIGLVAGLRLLSEVMKNPEEPIAYELVARITTDSWVSLPIRIVEKGTIDLGQR